MLYTPLTKKAMKIAYEAHKDQYDKSGVPYVFHPYHLAEQMDSEYATCAALLHDVVEDTDMTLNDLRKEGFPQEVIFAIAALTHPRDLSYEEYIDRIRQVPLAKKVKIADLRHNMQLSRLDAVTDKDLQRVEKYKASLTRLCGEAPPRED